MSKTLKEKLDDEFSTYIRLRDSDENGICKCISCGKPFYYLYGDNGHFINRKHMSLRFSETNCNAQCKDCNIFDEGNFEGYRRGLIAKYGEKIIDELYALKHQVNKISNVEYSIAIKHYQNEIKRLKSEKNLK